MPQAYAEGGPLVAFATSGGFLAACALTAGSIETGVARRDEHLRSPDFFFVALHPVVRFRSNASPDWVTETCT
jgi:hypothetical protein